MHRFYLHLLILCLSTSCRSPTQDKGEETGETALAPEDLDQDGYASDEDCDDDDPTIHPDAIEICNDRDDNCDGWIDDDDPTLDPESQTTWYADSDTDGYGSESDFVNACIAPSGYVAESDSGFDCDDTDPTYHPGATESDCTDPNDYNCDGSVGYADEDGDGFAACEDCDDSLAAINEDAIEICDGLDNDCDGWTDDLDPDLTGAPVWYGDADADTYGGQQFTINACNAPQGYVDNADDCNDLDPNSYPGATEVCDETDNNCDGDIDEGVQNTYYADTDNDGYGDSNTTVNACTVPTGYVWDSSDCDDSSATTNPASYEVCDGSDNNCDGVIDEASALNAETWYLDADSDGYGGTSSTDISCNQPTGYVADNTDCDDSSSSIYPGADEYCDSVDTDCDGTLDEDDALDAETWYADADSDGYGDSASTEIACDQPTAYIADNTDCDDTSASIYPGADEYCDTVDTDCDGTLDEDDATDASIWYADADGDGYGDSATTDTACSQPSGYSADDSDCDDGDSNQRICATCFEWFSFNNSGDGSYLIDPASNGTGFTAYCDMTTDGGGWTLVGMIHRATTDNVTEPDDWFANGNNSTPLSTNTMSTNSSPSAFATSNFSSYLSARTSAIVSRFEATAQADTTHTETWYKAVTSSSYSTWFSSDSSQSATLVCEDVSLSSSCTSGKINRSSGSTNLQGMDLGYGDWHLRTDGDSAAQHSALCAADGGAVMSTSYSGHWGHSLRIWLR
jgi:hypothetical protein